MMKDLKWTFYFVFATAMVVVYVTWFKPTSSSSTKFVLKPTSSSSTKYVLYWSPFWRRNDYYIGVGYKPFEDCEFKNCYATFDRSFMPVEQFDVLIFHASTYNEKQHQKPRVRKPHQRYVFMNLEAPVHRMPKNLKRWNSFYNWTMTYRLDSDIVRRHGYVFKRKDKYQMPSEEFLNNKTKLAAWFVSNCKTESKRELLGKELKKYIDVDVYGNCGNLKCDRQGSKISPPQCYDMVERQYKFYFSFENSFCKDYATEKLYNILPRDIVPVVYGFGNYTHSTPPNSVISVADFDSVKDLANYLKEVAADHKKYLKYFEWKKEYEVLPSHSPAMCQICQNLHQPVTTSIYHDIYEWWRGANESMCRLKKNLPKVVSDLL